MSTNFIRFDQDLLSESAFGAQIDAWNGIPHAKLKQLSLPVFKAKMSSPKNLNIELHLYRQMSKILISCATGLRNSGDEAILQAMLQSFRNIPNVWIKVFSFDADFTQRIHTVDVLSHSLVKHPIQILSAIKWCDVFVLGGGGLLQDETSLLNIPFWISKLSLASLLGKKTYVYSNSIGPVKHYLNRKIIRYTLNKVDIITLRDSMSMHLLRSCKVDKPPICVTADPVFNLVVQDKDQISSNCAEIVRTDRGVLIFLRHWFDQFPLLPVKACVKYDLKSRKDRKAWDYFTSEFGNVVDWINDALDFDVIFFAMCPGRDQRIAEAILQKTKNSQRNLSINKYYEPGQIVGLIQRSRFTIAMRLHAIVYSILAEKPFVSLAYSLKSKALLDDLNMSDYGMLLEDFSAESFIALLQHLVKDRVHVVDGLRTVFERSQIMCQRNVEYLDQLLTE